MSTSFVKYSSNDKSRNFEIDQTKQKRREREKERKRVTNFRRGFSIHHKTQNTRTTARNHSTTSTTTNTMEDQGTNFANGDTNKAKKRTVIVGTSETGTPPLVPSGNIETMIFKFHNFAELPHHGNNVTESKPINCHGYDWCFCIYPGGFNHPKTKPGFTSAMFGLKSPTNMNVEVKTLTKFRCGTSESQSEPRVYDNTQDFIIFELEKREKILQHHLESDGSLTIEVDLDIYVPKTKVWYPTIIKDEPFLSKLYDEEDETNASFDVNGKKFDFHRNVLKLRAPGLYEAVQECQGKGLIPISDVDESVFDVIRKYIYNVLEIEMTDLWESLDTTKTILVAADKFECTPLKLYAESVLVDKFLTPDSCAMLLVLADSHSCPLLKEAAQKVYKNDPAAVSKSDGWKNLIVDCPKLLCELLHYCTIPVPSYDENNVDTWDVTTLRKKLQDSNLEICDGSKEMLVKQWKDQQDSK